MIEETTFQKYYRDVPAAHLDRFRIFLSTHTQKQTEIDGTNVSYHACGQGARTLLTFCGGHSTPDTAWETIQTYERDYRVIVIDISSFGNVVAFSHGINWILEEEGVDRVVLLGASLAGIMAQIYFKQNVHRVAGLILMNTPAIKPASDKPMALLLTKLIPGSVLRATFRAKFRGYFKKALEDSRASDAARFGLAHMDEIMSEHFTKKKMINILSLVFEFGRQGYTRADFGDWPGKVLVLASEDDQGFKDLSWLTENLPNASVHTFPKGLGHLPQLAHKEELETLIRNFLAFLGSDQGS